MAHVHLLLPSGAVMSASLPLNAHMAKQLANGVLRFAEVTDPPAEDLDGEGEAGRVPVSPTVDSDDPAVSENAVAAGEAPKGNASTDEWAAYAVSQGMDPGEAAGLKRDEIKARLDEMKAADSPPSED